tara:strand:- start:505 stop:1515 length:1011 start_codon:yes stop_codon:yes gene_type:complete
MKRIFIWGVLVLFISVSCKPNTKQESTETTSQIQIEFSYQNITGIGRDSIYNRRDNSDMIKVGDTYYVWYTRMDSPVTAGYWGTIWYATSEDEGYTWTEQGMALGLGNEESFDGHSVFTPNILAYESKYYLYYTGVKATPGNPDREFENNSTTDITAIGLAVADSPDGPFERLNSDPVLEVSADSAAFDSLRIDDASLLVKEGKIWLYYKGRCILDGKAGPGRTKMSVAIADNPEGPFTKHDGPLLDKSHEVLIWKKNGGIASLASISSTINFAPDGLQFSVLQDSINNLPQAPGLYRPDLEDGCQTAETPGWGLAMRSKKGETYLVRFEMNSKNK